MTAVVDGWGVARVRDVAGQIWRSFAAAGCAVLVACGGGGGGDEVSGNAPLPEAFAITAQPTDQSTVSGGTATFAVRTNRESDARWEALAPDGWVPIDGANSASYARPAAEADDGARFRVVVTERVAGGAVLVSSAVVLRVTAAPRPPVIVVPPRDVALLSGQSGVLAVTASGTALSYQWQRSSDGTTFTDIEGATLAMLQLPQVTSADHGAVFRVVVGNALGQVTSEGARVTVSVGQAAPLFTAGPSPMQVAAGQPATFTVAVTGSPSATLQWQSSRDGVTWSDLTGQHDASLVLAAVALQDDGLSIRCVASNSAGKVESPSARLTVFARPAVPVITEPPVPVSVGVGGRPAFRATATGVPTPTLQWQVSVDAGATFTNITGATQADHTFAPVASADNGKLLRIVATNGVGEATSAAVKLTVRPAPHIAAQPEARAWRTGLPLPRFAVEASGGALRYRWQIRAGAGGFIDLPGGTGASVTVTPPAEDAEVRVLVSNAQGDTSASDTVALRRIRWTYESPAPTGDGMRRIAWVDGNRVVAVGDGGTVLHSADAGQSWAVVRENDAADSPALNGLAFQSPALGIAVGERGSVLRTVDGGLEWSTVRAASSNQPDLRAVAFVDALTVVAVGDAGGVLRSTDGGLTWTAVAVDALLRNFRNRDDHLLGVAFQQGTGLIVGEEGVRLLSVNGGAQWTRVERTYESQSDVVFAGDGRVMIGTYRQPHVSTDGGRTWVWSGEYSPAPFPPTMALAFLDGNRGVAVPRNGDTPRFTADGGATWSPSTGWTWDQGLDSPAVAAVAAGPAGVLVAAGANGRLARSIDGGRHWSRVDTTAVASTFHFQQVVFRGAGLGLAIGRDLTGFDRTIYRTRDGGQSWILAHRESGSTLVNLAFADDQVAWVTDSNGSLLRSIDGGQTWTGPVLPRGHVVGEAGAVAFSSRAVGLYVGGDGFLARTIDGGEHWDAIAGAEAWMVCGQQVTFITPQHVVLVTCVGEVHRSTDGGLTWQRVANTIIRHGNAIESTTVAFATSDEGIAAGSFGTLQRTTDGGATWRVLPEVPAAQSHLNSSRAVWFVSASEGYVVGAHVPTLRTVDGGVSWTADQGLRGGGLRGGAAVPGGGSVVVGQRGTVMRRSR